MKINNKHIASLSWVLIFFSALLISTSIILPPRYHSVMGMLQIILFLTGISLYDYYRGSRLLPLFLISSTIGFIFEVMGLKLGFPFGFYSYSDYVQPKIVGVPLIVIVFWGIFSTYSFMAVRILDRAFIRIFLFPLLMVIYDISIDPLMVKLGFWAWKYGGKYLVFDIPISNFLGWYLVSLVIIVFYEFVSKPNLNRMKKNMDYQAGMITYVFSVGLYSIIVGGAPGTLSFSMACLIVFLSVIFYKG